MKNKVINNFKIIIKDNKLKYQTLCFKNKNFHKRVLAKTQVILESLHTGTIK